MKIFYFTSTGNCLYIAKELGGEHYSIPQILNNNQLEFEDDVVGFIIPTYGMVAPGIVQEFIKKVKIKSRYTFAIMTFGNASNGSCRWFANFARKNAIEVHYVKSLKMVDNYLPMFDQKEQKAMNKNIPVQLADIKSDIERQKYEIEKGSSFLAGAMNTLFKPFETNYKKFSVTDECNGCGTCSKVCPRGNIMITKGPEFGENCEACLACVQLCPKIAIKIKGEKNPNERFRNENVSLKEIIDSNNIK